MEDLGLIDHEQLANQQFGLISNWMDGNHPEYASIMDDPAALTSAYNKVELFFNHHKINISAESLRSHQADLKDWLRQSEEDMKQYTTDLDEEKKGCGCQTKSKRVACCCQKKQWLLWLALGAILLILINVKQYVVAAVYAIAVLVISQPKLLKDVL